MAKWTTEYDKFAGYDCMGGAWVVRDESEHDLFVVEDPAGAEAKEIAGRIVACVNACEGINPEAVPGLLEACRVVLALLVRGVTHFRGRHRIKILDAALAKAEEHAHE